MNSVHTIPVPEGWSAEQAWTTIHREGRLPERVVGLPMAWAVVVVDERGELVEVERTP